MAATIRDAFALKPSDNENYTSVNLPEKMGNSADIAFGGAVFSMSLNAGITAVPNNFFLYSATGYYLGPTLASEKIAFGVVRVRQTKTFQTVRVEARQLQKGTERMTFYLTMDFQVVEPAVMLYNLPPRIQHPPPDQCINYEGYLKGLVEKGELNPRTIKAWEIGFSLFRRFFDQRPTPESVSGQNLLGMHKTGKTTQDHLKIHEKSSASWVRSRIPLTQAESYAALGFVMDAALAFLPCTFRNEFLDDYGALSTLDCALRVHSTDFSFNDWLLHEQVTEAANDGRTFSTGRIFRQDGLLIATMHQMSIIRAKPKI